MTHFSSNSAAKEKHDLGEPRVADRSPDPSRTVPDPGCMELLWENGQIVMQGISNITKKASTPTTFPSTSGKSQEKEVGHTDTTLKAGRNGAIGPVGGGFQTTTPLGQTAMMNNQEDEMVPRLDYPLDDYYLEFLAEVSGIDPNLLSPAVPADEIPSYGQAKRDTHGSENASISRAPAGCSEPNRMRSNQFSQFQQQCQSFIASSRPKSSDLMVGATEECLHGDLPNKRHKQDPTSSKLMQPRCIAPVMNFSHFSWPAALVKSNLQRIDGINSSEKACIPARSNATQSKLIKSATGLKSVPAFHGQMTSVTSKADLRPSAHPAQETSPLQHSQHICQENAARDSGNLNNINTETTLPLLDNMTSHSPSFRVGVIAATCQVGEAPVPDTASPSMWSANRAGATPHDVKNRAKRKSHDGDESEYQSEDLEDDSMAIRKPFIGRGRSTKRSRAAEVHNLSERRRRDRINEKLRALQKLIPNCTKVDKASMLDEAIKYLKTLQTQLQIMSMCNGLHMMPMMLPSGMQQIHPYHVGPFAPVGPSLGMGMGLGFGMGMPEMTSSSMIPVPHMHEPLCPCGSIPGAPGLHRMRGATSLQMFGIPQQALSMSMPHPTPLTPSMGLSTKVNPAPEVPGAEVSSEQVMDSAPPIPKKQRLQTLEPAGETSAQVETSKQPNKECSEHPSLVQIDNQPAGIDGNAVTEKDTGISSTL